MEAAGYVSKKRDDTDRRSVSVKLEPQGDAFVAEIESHNFGLIVGSTTSLSAEEQEAFVIVARNLDKALGVSDRIDADA